MRPIDADELKDKLIRLAQDDDLKFWAPVIGACVKEVDDAPTVSPDMAQVLAYECGKNSVQVVQCKDCKRWDDVPADEKTQDHECHLFDGNKENIRIASPSYWFCPMGERRSE